MKTNNEYEYNTQDEIIQNDETIVSNTQNEDLEGTTVPTDELEEGQAPIPTKKGQTDWRAVVISGGAGVMLGVAGTTWLSSRPIDPDGNLPEPITDDDETMEEVQQPTDTTPLHTELSVAHNVTDNMSFSEAFAAARQEVGAGGVFEWHGGIYGTYYANEWNDMTPQQQSDFTHDAIGAVHTSVTHEETQSPEDSGDCPDDMADNPIPEPSVPTPVIEIEGHPFEIEVYGVESGIDPDTGNQVNVGYGRISDHLTSVLDGDGDGKFDFILIDNGDGVVGEEDYLAPIEGGSGLDVDTFNQNIESQDATALNDESNIANNDDYVNDGDVSEFA